MEKFIFFTSLAKIKKTIFFTYIYIFQDIFHNFLKNFPTKHKMEGHTIICKFNDIHVTIEYILELIILGKENNTFFYFVLSDRIRKE